MLEKVNQDYKTKGQVKRRILGVGGQSCRERAVYLVVCLIALGSTLRAYAGKPSSQTTQTTQEQPLAPAAVPPSENSNNSNTTPQTSGNTSAQQGGTGFGTLAIGGGTAILGIGTAAYVSKKYLESRWPKNTEFVLPQQNLALEDPSRAHYWTQDPGGEIIEATDTSKGKLSQQQLGALAEQLKEIHPKIQPMGTAMSVQERKQFNQWKTDILNYVQAPSNHERYDADVHGSLKLFMEQADLKEHRQHFDRLDEHFKTLQHTEKTSAHLS